MARQRPRRTSPLYLPSAFDLFKPSKDLVWKYIDIFLPLFIIPFIFWLRSWIWTPAHGWHFFDRTTDANWGWTFPGSYPVAIIGFSILWFLFAIAAGTLVQIMLQRAELDASEGRKPDIGRSWDVVKEMGLRMLGLYLVEGVLIAIGFVLLVIPGLILLRRFFFAPYIMLEKKCDIRTALEKSTQLSSINTGSVWGVIGVLFLIGFVGIVPIIGSLASFILGCLYSVAPALRYQQLKKLA